LSKIHTISEKNVNPPSFTYPFSSCQSSFEVEYKHKYGLPKNALFLLKYRKNCWVLVIPPSKPLASCGWGRNPYWPSAAWITTITNSWVRAWWCHQKSSKDYEKKEKAGRLGYLSLQGYLKSLQATMFNLC